MPTPRIIDWRVTNITANTLQTTYEAVYHKGFKRGEELLMALIYFDSYAKYDYYRFISKLGDINIVDHKVLKNMLNKIKRARLSFFRQHQVLRVETTGCVQRPFKIGADI